MELGRPILFSSSGKLFEINLCHPEEWIGELLALREGLRTAAVNGWTVAFIESDALSDVNLINSAHPISTEDSILSDIHYFISLAGHGGP
ncbi:hypothetical protein PanWU01x14_331250 [Parasponia andersonii]|uniref:RNase H type-1 domain-containing protein n=1 Tax=Parasponia andersonii TaxID=3476 RepID=A0A2P5AHS5_PARAD|nr:hypothetical protein PanWU01x14_331250 [Parasponia andersonii]